MHDSFIAHYLPADFFFSWASKKISCGRGRGMRELSSTVYLNSIPAFPLVACPLIVSSLILCCLLKPTLLPLLARLRLAEWLLTGNWLCAVCDHLLIQDGHQYWIREKRVYWTACSTFPAWVSKWMKTFWDFFCLPVTPFLFLFRSISFQA